ncbi:MAG: alpha/beta fold hydrolase [Spirochaetia bacterium]
MKILKLIIGVTSVFILVSCAGEAMTREDIDWFQYSENMQVNGINVHYLDIDIAGTEHTLVYIHGYSSCNLEATFFAEYLQNDMRIIAPDLPGCGYTDKPNVDYTTGYFVEFVRDFIDELGIENYTLLGHSMGGKIASTFAYEYGDELNRLILMAPLGIEGEAGPFLTTLSNAGLLVDVGLSLNNPAFFRIGLENIIFYDPDNMPEIMVPYFTNWLFTEEAIRSVVSVTKHVIGYDYVDELLSEIEVNTLIIWGVNDELLPYRYADEFHSRLPNSRLVSFDRCGHMPQVERSEDSARVISAFIRNGDR